MVYGCRLKEEKQQQQHHNYYGDAHRDGAQNRCHSYGRVRYAGQIVQLSLTVFGGRRHSVAEVTAAPQTEPSRVFGHCRVAYPFRSDECHPDDYRVANREYAPQHANRFGVSHVIGGVQLGRVHIFDFGIGTHFSVGFL